jgi:hypothetical protein
LLMEAVALAIVLSTFLALSFIPSRLHLRIFACDVETC